MFTKIFVPINNHYGYLKKLECFKLETQFAQNYTSPLPPEMESINHKRAVWNINLENNKICRMRNEFGCIDNKFYIVHVDALKFYYYWLVSSIYLDDQHRSNHCILRKDMPNDYKFKHAIDGFSISEHNPVPLAFVSARFEHGNPYIGFTNGVTRTMWLLANGARSFPIEVRDKESAKHLYEFAGIGEPPITYQELRNKFNVKISYYESSEFLASLYGDT
ncbi:plasmid fertility inhibition factor family protein [Acinetobacter oleivorans]|uniref:plasmid fertility inhibition factor family protein n=1 Tax=Acinetobacter oleivorans TaxID=1148157 RepID=UPI003017A7D8